MIATLAPYWTRKLVHLFLDEIINTKENLKPSLEVRLRDETTMISFHRLPGTSDAYNAENYRVEHDGDKIWIPGDSFFPTHYGPHDLSDFTKRGIDLRDRVVTMLKENKFALVKENAMYPAQISDSDYVSLYVRKD